MEGKRKAASAKLGWGWGAGVGTSIKSSWIVTPPHPASPYLKLRSARLHIHLCRDQGQQLPLPAQHSLGLCIRSSGAPIRCTHLGL